MSFTLYNIVIILALLFISIYAAINRDVLSKDIDVLSHIIIPPIVSSFTASMGLVTGFCTVYYAFTKSCILGITEEFMQVPIMIGALLIIGISSNAVIKMFRGN